MADMLSILCFATFAFAAVSGLPDQRIIGGVETTIDKFPFAVVLLSSFDGAQYTQICGATIINNRSFLTSAQCVHGRTTSSLRGRVGSSFANSGGIVHAIAQSFVHPSYDVFGGDTDLAILHVTSPLNYGPNVQAARVGGAGYILGDNTPVTAIGWGETEYGGPASEQLRSVDIWTVNQDTCRSNYNIIAMTVSPNMMCAGYLGVGGRDTCPRDYGGPLLHTDVVVGVASMGTACGYANYPGIYARVAPHIDWIVSTA